MPPTPPLATSPTDLPPRRGDLRWARYLILDLDGTLTVRERLVPPVLAALTRAAEAGLELILNTGRSAGWGAALLSYVPGLSAAIVENGGAWFDRRAVDAAEDPAARSEEVHVQLLRPREPAALAEDRARLFALRERAGQRLGLRLPPTADDPFRLTDHTAVRTMPTGPDGTIALARLRALVQDETDGHGDILASSVHVHFMIDGAAGERAEDALPRSKADGALALLRRRGVADPAGELRRHAVVVGDSGNDASLFSANRFAMTVGVANIVPYLPELINRGAAPPLHITRAEEGLGVVELIDGLLAGGFAAVVNAAQGR